jgi:transcription initiation factor TFIIB
LTRPSSRPTARALGAAIDELDVLAAALLVPDEVRTEAARICRMGLEKEPMVRMVPARVSTSSFYAACREMMVPTTLDDVAAVSGVDRKEIARCYRSLIGELDLKIPVADASRYLAAVASRADVSAEVMASALEILARAEKAGLADGRCPAGLAASALYVAAALEGERLTQKEAAGAAGVIDATVRKAYKRLVNTLGLRLEGTPPRGGDGTAVSEARQPTSVPAPEGLAV